MTTPETIRDAIEQTAKGPSSVSVGAQTVQQQSIRDQIEADRYLASKQAATAPKAGFGIRFQRVKPPGGG